jgi:hypothetical protein
LRWRTDGRTSPPPTRAPSARDSDCFAIVDDCFYSVIDDKPKRTRRG